MQSWGIWPYELLIVQEAHIQLTLKMQCIYAIQTIIMVTKNEAVGLEIISIVDYIVAKQYQEYSLSNYKLQFGYVVQGVELT